MVLPTRLLDQLLKSSASEKARNAKAKLRNRNTHTDKDNNMRHRIGKAGLSEQLNATNFSQVGEGQAQQQHQDGNWVKLPKGATGELPFQEAATHNCQMFPGY